MRPGGVLGRLTARGEGLQAQGARKCRLALQREVGARGLGTICPGRSGLVSAAPHGPGQMAWQPPFGGSRGSEGSA